PGRAPLPGLREAAAPAHGPRVRARRLLLGRGRQPPEGPGAGRRAGQRAQVLPCPRPRQRRRRRVLAVPQGRRSGGLLLRLLVQLPAARVRAPRARRRDPPSAGLPVSVAPERAPERPADTVADRLERLWSHRLGL